MGVVVGSWLMSLVVLVYYSSAARAAEVHNFKWVVEEKPWSPDGRLGNEVITINGEFPGPTIRAHAGDTINLELINNLRDEGTVIHWHGIRQIGTPWADGTAFISQCPINKGTSFVYTFKVDKAGTYFYHGHLGMQRSAGLYGSLIVDGEGEKEKLEYDEELEMILLSDWWHKTSHQQEAELEAIPMVWIGEPKTLLINGKGQFGCSLYAGSDALPPCGEQYAPFILPVRPNKTYRLRIASTTALAALNFAIGNHKMRVVEADGNYVDPFSTDNIDIYSGESYSVLFTTDQDPSHNYWISVNVRARKPDTPPALAILNYLQDDDGTSPSASPAPAPGPSSFPRFPTSPPPVSPHWEDYDYSKDFINKILAAPGSPQPPQSHNRRIVLLNTQNLMDKKTKWSINNISLQLPETAYLGAIKYNLVDAYDQEVPPDNLDIPGYNISAPPPNLNTRTSSGVYTIKSGTTVDVILQNANMINNGASEIHPWHLHGHDFWILGYGEGKFDEDKAVLNLKNPPLRNTAVIFPYGWTALRFEADNPGVWAFHCHLEPHLHLGMGVVFSEGIDSIDNVPDEAIRCGLLAQSNSPSPSPSPSTGMAPDHKHALLQHLVILCLFILSTITIIS